MPNLVLSVKKTPSVLMTSGGTTDHSKLKHLGFEESGHTGFQRELTGEQLSNIDAVPKKENISNKVQKVVINTTEDLKAAHTQYPSVNGMIDYVSKVEGSLYNNLSELIVQGDKKNEKDIQNLRNITNVNITAEQTPTGAIITITDREGVQTSVHIDTVASIKTWEDVKNAVRMGIGAKLFPVGYEFNTEDAAAGTVITWVVRGHDHHAAVNKKLTHTMTLETKYTYSSAAGTYKTFDFDATEALYYAADKLPAGTYNFTLPPNIYTDNGGGKTLSFTLTKPVPAGGVIVFPWNRNTYSTDTKISTYASNAATEAIESVAVTESANGTSLGVADGTVENLNHVHRIYSGSNNYAQSAVRQWLNSNAEAGGVWTPTNIFDRPPSWNTSYSGFMLGLPADFLAVVQPAVIPCHTSSVFEVNSFDGMEFAINQVYTLQDKFFLLSRPEIFGDWDNPSYKDGEVLEFYEGLTDTERIKYDTAGISRYCWTRSPYLYYSSVMRYITNTGIMSSYYVSDPIGLTPACIIA